MKQKISDRAIRAMSYESRQVRFKQEKDEFLRTHPEMGQAETDEAIRKLASRWRV